MPTSATFLYRNKYGIFYFQRRIPESLQLRNTALPVLFRKSLRTRDPRLAARLARKMSVMFDELAARYFTSATSFAEALDLLARSNEASGIYQEWDDFETRFWLTLNEEQHHLINVADRWAQAKRLLTTGQSDSPQVPPILAQFLETLQAKKEHNSIKLSEAFLRFIEDKQQNWRPNSDQKKIFEDEIFPLLMEITGEIYTGQLASEHITSYKSAVLKLPKNRRKMALYRSLSLSEILTLKIPEDSQLSPTTKTNYLNRLKAFLVFLGQNGYANEKLHLPLINVIKKTTRQSDERSAFTDSDLNKLFNSEDYIKGRHSAPFKYWVPLIALLSGARLNEICQLHIVDICKDSETGFWVFDFNQNDAEVTLKRLKKPYHKRLVPIHPILIDLGFIKFFEKMKKKEATRLFPELPYTKDGNYGDKAQKWFNNTYTNSLNCGISTRKTSFHSLRHNFITYLTTKLNVPEIVFAHYVGQTAQGGVTTARYSKPVGIIEINNLFKRINYSACIDFKKIRKWT